METFKTILDLSDYPRDQKLYDATNKKKPLAMKVELDGQILLESTCLRSKLYSIKFDSVVTQSAKGVQKCMKKTLTHDLFTSIIESNVNICRVNTQIRSQQQQLVVTQVNKTVLGAFDDKRFLFDCSVKSFAYGHHSLKQSSNTFICFQFYA